MNLPEFKTASAQQAWRVKKETTELHFESLLKDTSQIALQVQACIDAVKPLLKLHSYQHVALIDEAIIFSILRGFSARLRSNGTAKSEIGWYRSARKPKSACCKNRCKSHRRNKEAK